MTVNMGYRNRNIAHLFTVCAFLLKTLLKYIKYRLVSLTVNAQMLIFAIL